MNCLALSPTNGRTLATGGDDRRINLWIVGQPNALMVYTQSRAKGGGGGGGGGWVVTIIDTVVVASMWS